MKKLWLLFLLPLFMAQLSFAQRRLTFHTEFVDSMVLWMNNGCNPKSIGSLSIQPAALIMEQLLKNQEGNTAPNFSDVLKNFNYKDSSSGNTYLLNNAYKSREEIISILEKIKKADFSDSIYSRVLKYFPKDYIPQRKYEVFYTATGWKWGDAMTFNYTVENNKYIISSSGIPAIIFNLTLVCNLYGNTNEERMAQLENVMSHELFHAIFADYRTNYWNNPKAWTEGTVEDRTLYLMLDEGLAHYISYRQMLMDNYTENEALKQYEKNAFDTLATNSNIIFNASNGDSLRNSTLEKGTYGNFWGKYICVTGFFMAYHIEQYYGLDGLKECTKNSPINFIKKYSAIPIEKQVPNLPDSIIRHAL